MRIHKTLALSGFLIVMACMSAAWAQETELDGADDPAVPFYTLPTMSVTATRNPTDAFEYPGMVTVIGRQELETYQASTPDDVLQFVPGVEFVGGPRRTGESPTIRGFSGPDVIILIDGARQNFNSGHNGNFYLDPSVLREIEVLRGPASSLYGSGGTGGVIEFRTINASDFLKPGETAGFVVGTGYQTVNREIMGTTTVFGMPLDGVDIVASLTGRSSGSIELGDGTKLDRTDDNIVSALFKTTFELTPEQELGASVLHFQNDAEEPSNGQGAGGTSLVDKTLESTNISLAYAYDPVDTDLVDLDVLAYYTYLSADEVRLDSNGAGNVGDLLTREVDTFGLRLDNRSRFDLWSQDALTLTYGTEAYQDTQNGTAGGGARDGVPDAQSDFGGIFMQGEFAFENPFGFVPGRVMLLPGVRWDQYVSSSSIAADNKDDHLSPRLGMSYMPTDWLMVFGNYAEAFRAPSFDELYLNGVHFRIPVGAGVTNRFISNPDLAAQTTTTTEFGFGLNFRDVLEEDDVFEFKASRAFIDGSNFIDLQVVQPELFVGCNPFIPGNCDGATQSVNVPDARLWSTEAEAAYENDRLRLTTGFSSINGKDQATGNRLGSLAPDQLTLGVAVKVHEMDSVVGWRALGAWRFDKVDSVADERDGYVVHDVYMSWQPSDELLGGLRVDLGIDNVFDKAYSRVFTNSLEAGRNYKAGVSYALSW